MTGDIIIDTLNTFLKLGVVAQADVRAILYETNLEHASPLVVSECKQTILEILWPEKYIGKLKECKKT